MKHVGMSQSATPATRNEAMRRWKARKVTAFAELTAWRGHMVLTRTVANGCATSGEHSLKAFGVSQMAFSWHGIKYDTALGGAVKMEA